MSRRLQYRLGVISSRTSPNHKVFEWGDWHDSTMGDAWQTINLRQQTTIDAIQVRIKPKKRKGKKR